MTSKKTFSGQKDDPEKESRSVPREAAFREFGAQTAAVTVAALREAGALAYVAASFREAKKEDLVSEFEGKFLEGLNDAFRLGVEGVRTQQEMSSYLHRVVIQIKNRVGELLAKQEGGTAEVRELDQLVTTERILSTAAAGLFDCIAREVREIVSSWQGEQMKEKLIEVLQSRVADLQDGPVSKKDLH